MAVALGPDNGGVRFADRYELFHPFTLKRDETRCAISRTADVGLRDAEVALQSMGDCPELMD